jgi:hypothetical protein
VHATIPATLEQFLWSSCFFPSLVLSWMVPSRSELPLPSHSSSYIPSAGLQLYMAYVIGHPPTLTSVFSSLGPTGPGVSGSLAKVDNCGLLTTMLALCAVLLGATENTEVAPTWVSSQF